MLKYKSVIIWLLLIVLIANSCQSPKGDKNWKELHNGIYGISYGKPDAYNLLSASGHQCHNQSSWDRIWSWTYFPGHNWQNRESSCSKAANGHREPGNTGVGQYWIQHILRPDTLGCVFVLLQITKVHKDFTNLKWV